jgi:hypothetical protein
MPRLRELREGVLGFGLNTLVGGRSDGEHFRCDLASPPVWEIVPLAQEQKLTNHWLLRAFVDTNSPIGLVPSGFLPLGRCGDAFAGDDE